jgi:hypothetical protein
MKQIVFGVLLFVGHFQLYGQTSAYLDTNDICASINSDGSFFDKFEIPKGSGLITISRGNIWMAGFDPAGALHVAAQSYPQGGSDLFYGPIASNYSTAQYISKYNKVWKISRSTIQYHTKNFKSSGYKVPESIKDWPAHGNEANGESRNLAPYFDYNLNDYYDPENGDYPSIKGDQTIYFILNDDKQSHSSSGGTKFGLEIHGMAYAFGNNIDSIINQTIFINYQIINRSNTEYRDFYFGIFTDMNIGFEGDDYVGSDSLLEMSYTYNSTNNDLVYGKSSPVQACIFMDYYSHDFNRNQKTGFINFNLNEPHYPEPTTFPKKDIEYLHYLMGRYKNGTALTQYGTGYNPGSTFYSTYAFNGNPLDILGGGWSELREQNKSGDRRGINTIGPCWFFTNTSICMTVAFPFVRDYNGDHLSSIALLHERIKSLISFYSYQYYSCDFVFVDVTSINSKLNQFSIFPNPSHSKIYLDIKSHEFIKGTFTLIDVYGQIVSRPEFEELKEGFDVSRLPSGTYFLLGKDQSRTEITKFIKTH